MKCISSKFLFFIVFIININEICSTLLFTYPSAVTLTNGNILVIEKDGIYICDQAMENIISNIFTFTEEDKIKDEVSLSRVIMKDKNGYIICLVNFKLFFISRTGILLTSTTNKLILDPDPTYFSLAPIYVKSNYYYYVIAYFDSSTKLKFNYYKISISGYSNIYINSFPFDNYKGYLGWNSYRYLNRGLSCEYMEATYDGSHYYYLVCYLMIDDDGDTITQDFYEINESKISAYHKYRCTYIEIQNVKQIKTITNNNIKRSLVLVFMEDNSNSNIYKVKIYKYYFEFKATHLDSVNNNYYNCIKNFYGMETNYLYEKDLLSFSCIISEAEIQSILLNNDLNIAQTNKQFGRCESIFGHSVLYSNYFNKYYVVSDVKCDRHQRTFFPLIGEVPVIEDETEEEKSEIYVEEKLEIDEEEKMELIEENKYLEEKIELLEEEKEKEYMKVIESIMDGDILEEIMEDKYDIILEEEKIFEKENIEAEKEISYIIENEKSTYIQTDLKIDCPELEKCSQCNPESISKNLCIKCNNINGYYLLKSNYNSNNNKYIDCVNNITKPYNYYFDQNNQDYEPCYETCFKCDKKGDWLNNNCISCDGITYIKKPEYEDSNNCVLKCKYYYYYTDSGIYKCTGDPYCPDDYNYLIKNKNKCTNDCKKDNIYKYYYNRECLTQCPENTEDDGNFICKDSAINRCILSENNFFLFNENITDDMIEKMTMIYAAEFGYTDTHVSVYYNDIYTITIYKDLDCISDLDLNVPEIIFGECELKIKRNYNINEKLIIAIIDKKIEGNNQRKMISYGLYSPSTGIKLPSNDICEDDKIMVLESLSLKMINSNVDLSTLSQLYSQGIDIFDLSSSFYTDVCFQYNSINTKNMQNKDIALKDRVLVFFPNITLCEQNCDMKGINLTTLKAICECSYSSGNKDLLKDNALYESQVGQLEEFISSTNIYVMKCYKNIFSISYFKECIGGLIIIILLIIEIICTINYYLKGFSSIKIYILNTTKKFISIISPQKENKHSIKNIPKIITINEPVKADDINKKITNNLITENNSLKSKQQQEKKNNLHEDVIIYKINRKHKGLTLRRHLLNMSNKEKIFENNKYNEIRNSIVISEQMINSKESKKEMMDSDEKNRNIFHEKERQNINIINKQIAFDKPVISNKVINYKNSIVNISSVDNIVSNRDLNINIKHDNFFDEYLKTEFDDMDYDDILEKDKRKFCQYLKEKIIANQIIINVFCSEEPLKPMSIKILLLVLQIDLYFLINGLFYDEEYASNIFHLEKDSFYDAMGRFFGNLVYAALVGIIINYIIEWFFIEESQVKKIYKKKKGNISILKSEIIRIILKIKIRYIFFIVITFLITIFTLIHISCFNIVYSHLKWEWMIFSIIIIVFMQIFSVLICLIHTILRYTSLKCNSEKIYKISYLIS